MSTNSNKIVTPSTNADFNNYVYNQVIVGGGSTTGYTVTFNGITLNLPNSTVFDMDVKSVQVGNPNVYLGGYLIAFDFPKYFGNSWNTDYLGNPIIQNNGGGVFAQSGNSQYAFYK